MRHFTNRWLLVLLFLLGTTSSFLQGEERLLTVMLASGREFTAHVDSRTDEERLCLRFSSGGGSILRPIAWNRITAARLGDQEIAIKELKRTCEELKSTSPPRVMPANSPASAPTSPSSPPVAFIRIDAWVANWDADVEPDGVRVQLEPCDENGTPVAVSGTAEIELFAARARKYHEAPQSGGWSTELIERWNENVEAKEIDPRGVLLKLPLGAIHPDFTTGVGNWGLIHVRIVVPGSGVFEQSIDGVRLRNWSPVRDGLFLQSGRRFFSTEGTQRN